MIRVLIVEDDPMARQLLELYIGQQNDYVLAGSLESAAFALSWCLKNPVDVILMDICTALHASGLREAEKIKAALPAIKIVLITSQPECSFLSRAREAGVDSFWYKNPDARSLMSVLDRTLAGESVYPQATPEVKVGLVSSRDFTPRELDVLRELLTGDSNAQIASRLFMSEKNVRNYISQMMAKTGLNTRTKLAVAADRAGLVNKDY